MIKKIFIFYIFLSFQIAFSTTFVNRPLQDVLDESSIIVRGKTGDSFTEYGVSDKSIYTYTYFYVTEVIKGDLKKDKIKLRQPGGSKDGLEMHVPGTASFNMDEDVVLLLGDYNKDDDSYDIPGFATGKYIVKEEGSKIYLENSLGASSFYDPNKTLETQSYSSKIEYDLFKKLAQKKIKNLNFKQFLQSKKVVEDHHHDYHSNYDEQEKAKALKQVIKQVEEKNEKVRDSVQEVSRYSLNHIIFIGIIFILLGIVIFILIKKSK
jgi:hypothetical protein